MNKQVQKQQSIDANNRVGSKIYAGTFIAEVMDNKDVMQKAGRLWVFIPDFGGIKTEPSTWIPVSYASPFYGISPHAAPRDEKATPNTPVTTYGFWAIPPDIGVRVLCTFVDGETSQGYWFAVVPTVSHGMIPANGAPDGKTPMMDFNPLAIEVGVETDLSNIQRQPYEALTQQFTTQGLAEDPVRGPITSSSFRESPSRVFGISSQSTPEAPGHTFVMDDGGEDGKNKLIRIRSSSGNQITMSDDTGMIYLINAQGTGWIELSPSGQIDVFGAAGINMATNGEINLHADKNVNIHAGECVKIVGVKGTKVQGGQELQLHGAKTMIEGVDSLHVHSCKEMMFTSFGDIHMKAFNYFCLKGKCFYWNSCTAKEAEQVPPEEPSEVSGYQTTVARAPSKEPYKEHDGGQGAGGGGGAGGTGPTGQGGSGTDAGGMFGGSTIDNGPTSASAISAAIKGNSGSIQPTNTNVGIIGSDPNSFGIGGATIPGTSASSIKPSSFSNSSTFSADSVTKGGSSGGMSFNGIRSSQTTSATRVGSNPTRSSTFSQASSNATSLQKVQSTPTVSQLTRSQELVAAGKAETSLGNSINTTKPGNVNSSYPYGGDTSVPGNVNSSYPYGGNTTTPGGPAASGLGGATRGIETAKSRELAESGPLGGSTPTSTPTKTPAQEASEALSQAGGQMPASDLPAAPGGGGTGCFATGDNCERPVDETGGPGSPQGGLDQSGQSAGDIPSNASDEDIAARTIAGECRGCSPEEQAAIGEVLRNRAKANGTTVAQEARRAYQFSTWNAGDPNRSYITNLSTSSPTYQSALNAYRSSANTNYAFGATHYYNARTVTPSWAKSMTTTNTYGSGHRFGYIRGEFGK